MKTQTDIIAILARNIEIPTYQGKDALNLLATYIRK